MIEGIIIFILTNGIDLQNEILLHVEGQCRLLY